MDRDLPRDEPAAGFRWPLDGSAGGFFNSRDPGAVAALREMLGAEGFERWQRSAGLREHPRPLTDLERSVLREAAAPVLADLAASGLSVPDVREEAHEERAPASVCAWIQDPGRTGEGIWILLDSSPAEQVAELAAQFQNWAADQLHDAGRAPEWPACPQHRDRPHRLEPEVRDGAAAWACPESGQVIGAIGALEMAPRRGTVTGDRGSRRGRGPGGRR